MHCNLRPPDPSPALSRINYDAMPSLTSLNLSIAVLCRFCCWYITLRRDLDLWPWTFAPYRLWRDETLYQIWTQSNNPRRSCCDFSVWPYGLEHVLSVALDSGIIFTKFDLPQLIRAWIIAFLCWYAMSSCDLDLLTLNFGCHAFKLCTKFERNRIIYGWVIDDLAGFRVQF